MNATPQKLSAVPLPGLTLDTLGVYLAALGLLRILSRKWPSIRGCWRNGIFHIIASEITIEAINEYLLSLQDADWPEFQESWKKEADQTEKNRTKNGVLNRVFAHLQTDQLVRLKLEALSLDSTIVQVHPDGTGALKKTGPKPSASPAGAGPPRFIWLPRMLERR